MPVRTPRVAGFAGGMAANVLTVVDPRQMMFFGMPVMRRLGKNRRAQRHQHSAKGGRKRAANGQFFHDASFSC